MNFILITLKDLSVDYEDLHDPCRLTFPAVLRCHLTAPGTHQVRCSLTLGPLPWLFPWLGYYSLRSFHTSLSYSIQATVELSPPQKPPVHSCCHSLNFITSLSVVDFLTFPQVTPTRAGIFVLFLLILRAQCISLALHKCLLNV